MPSIDIDRDAAHQAAQTELDKPIYGKASVGQQFSDWVNELIYRLLQNASLVPGGWLTSMALFVLLAVAVVVAVRVARRTMRTHRGGDYELFGAALLTAAQHRATAESYAEEGNWAAAIRHRLRAVARQLEETGVLEPALGRTANELANDAGTALPHLSAELSQSAMAFNDVTYGDRPGTPEAYRMIADLDDHLRDRATTTPAPTGPPAAGESWAKIR